MPKQIWIINQAAGDPTSGSGERHYYLSKKWVRKGYKVTIISSSFNHMFSHNHETTGQFTATNYDGTDFCWVKSLKYDPNKISRFIVMLLFALKVMFVPTKRFGKPDIIIVSSMPIFPIVSGYLLKKRHRAEKLIFEIRDLWPLSLLYLKNVSKWHPLVIFIGWFEKFGYRRSDYIVSLLPQADTYINAISKKPKKFKYIPNGVSKELLKNKKSLNKDYFKNVNPDDFVVGYTGTMNLANALEPILEAGKLLDPNIKIVMVGRGYLKDTFTEKYKNQKNIVFLPRVTKNQVQSVLKQYDACIISWHDIELYNYGVSANKYFDYMLSGKPIISANSFPKSPVELAQCGMIVKPNSEIAVAEAINQMAKMSKDNRESMGQKGKDFVLKYHTYEYLSDKYIELFD